MSTKDGSLKIIIDDMGYAAFDDCDAEVARILRLIARRVATGLTGSTIHDINGNPVGEWAYDRPETEDDNEEDEGDE